MEHLSTHKHWTRLESLARDNCFSLLCKVITYVCKKFYNIDTRPDPEVEFPEFRENSTAAGTYLKFRSWSLKQPIFFTRVNFIRNDYTIMILDRLSI